MQFLSAGAAHLAMNPRIGWKPRHNWPPRPRPWPNKLKPLPIKEQNHGNLRDLR